jgi:hypothetical protein
MKRNLIDMKKTAKDIPYVLVQNRNTGKAFALSRGYRLMSNDVPMTVKLWMTRNQTQNSVGWFPTQSRQSPAWAKKLVSGDFTAYWIDYDKHYQELVVTA